MRKEVFHTSAERADSEGQQERHKENNFTPLDRTTTHTHDTHTKEETQREDTTRRTTRERERRQYQPHCDRLGLLRVPLVSSLLFSVCVCGVVVVSWSFASSFRSIRLRRAQDATQRHCEHVSTQHRNVHHRCLVRSSMCRLWVDGILLFTRVRSLSPTFTFLQCLVCCRLVAGPDGLYGSHVLRYTDTIETERRSYDTRVSLVSKEV